MAEDEEVLSLGSCHHKFGLSLKGAYSIASSEARPVFPQAAPIVDVAWYPSASSRDPSTYCFVASVRDCPVKLLDATDGRVR